MKRYCIRIAIIALFFGFLMPSWSTAAPVVVTDRASLGGTNFVDWGQLGPPGTEVASPFIIPSSSKAVSLSVTNLEAPSLFKILVQQPLLSPELWNGNFAEGDRVLWTDFLIGPMVIEFSRPVVAAGAQIQMNLWLPFTAKLDVYDIRNTLIASFTLNGISNGATDNSAIFLGVRDTGATIKRIVYSVVDSADSSPMDFAINQLDLLVDMPVPSMSQGGLILFALLLMGVALLFARRRRTA
jgi:hypothetical protein